MHSWSVDAETIPDNAKSTLNSNDFMMTVNEAVEILPSESKNDNSDSQRISADTIDDKKYITVLFDKRAYILAYRFI